MGAVELTRGEWTTAAGAKAVVVWVYMDPDFQFAGHITRHPGIYRWTRAGICQQGAEFNIVGSWPPQLAPPEKHAGGLISRIASVFKGAPR